MTFKGILTAFSILICAFTFGQEVANAWEDDFIAVSHGQQSYGGHIISIDITNQGRELADCIKNAKQQALFVAIFKGYSKSAAGPASAAIAEKQVYNKNMDFFKGYLTSNTEGLNFATSAKTNTTKPSVKISNKVIKTTTTVVINKAALQADIESHAALGFKPELLVAPGNVHGFAQDYKVKSGTFDYKNGGQLYVYNGEYIIVEKEKLPHGDGTLAIPDLSIEKLNKKGYSIKVYSYGGKWENGKKNGEGIEKNGRMIFTGINSEERRIDRLYNGAFISDKRNGQGKLVCYKAIPYPGELQHYITGDRLFIKEYNGTWLENEMSGEGNLLFTNGTEYSGILLNGIPDGEGTMKSPDGKYMKGTWKNFDFTGEASKTYKKLDRRGYNGTYEGSWKNGFWQKGKFVWQAGKGENCSMEGVWNENKTFTGKFHAESEGGILVGKLINNKQDSIWTQGKAPSVKEIQGMNVTVFQEINTGLFAYSLKPQKVLQDFSIDGYILIPQKAYLSGEGERNIGQGRDVYAGLFENGLIVSGKWNRNDETTGQYTDDISYEGTFSKSVPHGEGKMTFSGKESFEYEGGWFNGLKEGFGIEELSSEMYNAKYEGSWAGNEKNGQGSLIEEYYDFEMDKDCKSSYTGNFKSNIKNGIGVETTSDGVTYKGEFVDNVRNGKGVLTKKNGEKLDGSFINGEYQKPFKCKVVIIGNHLWMTEDFRLTKFRNGDEIPQATSRREWIDYCEKSEPCWAYSNFIENEYPVLYNCFTILDLREIAPAGYRVPNLLNLFDMVNSVAGQDYFATKKLGGIDYDDPDHYNVYRSVIQDWDFRKIVAKKLKGVSGWPVDKTFWNGNWEITDYNGNNTSKFNALGNGSMGYSYDDNIKYKVKSLHGFNVWGSDFGMWLTKDGVNESFWNFRSNSELVFEIHQFGDDPILWTESDIGYYSGHVIRLIKE
tara:strand:+ start:61 stop:2895 length:2835 start_codon:yes stop_codon:yes gene_type:complete